MTYDETPSRSTLRLLYYQAGYIYSELQITWVSISLHQAPRLYYRIGMSSLGELFLDTVPNRDHIISQSKTMVSQMIRFTDQYIRRKRTLTWDDSN
jgi:hypothetical protein